jgi:hypothetical protein
MTWAKSRPSTSLTAGIGSPPRWRLDCPLRRTRGGDDHAARADDPRPYGRPGADGARDEHRRYGDGAGSDRRSGARRGRSSRARAGAGSPSPTCRLVRRRCCLPPACCRPCRRRRASGWTWVGSFCSLAVRHPRECAAARRRCRRRRTGGALRPTHTARESVARHASVRWPRLRERRRDEPAARVRKPKAVTAGVLTAPVLAARCSTRVTRSSSRALRDMRAPPPGRGCERRASAGCSRCACRPFAG